MPEEQNIDSNATQDNPDAAETNNEETNQKTQETQSTETSSGLPGGDGEETPDTETDNESSDTEQKGAPESYEDFDISLGEDIGYSLTDDQKESFIALGKENGFTQEQMNKLVAFDIERARATMESNNKFIEDYKAEGIKATRKEHGDKYASLHKKIGGVYQKFFDEEFRKSLNDMGISSQPGFFNALNKISSVLSEDVTVPGDSTSAIPKTLAEKIAAQSAKNKQNSS